VQSAIPIWGGSIGTGLALLAGFCVVSALGSRGVNAEHRSSLETEALPTNDGSYLPVNTVTPTRKTLVRTLHQPASIVAWAQAELHAKVPGIVKQITRDKIAGAGSTLPPERDIGSLVAAGDILLEIDAPELIQDVAAKDAILKQAQAELEQARANLSIFEAALALETKKLKRIGELAKKKTVTEELLDEKQAEVAVVSAKLAGARADILVKEARVRVAEAELDRARILASYTKIRAPFTGVISSRTVDIGDFVQNASTGHPQPLMTVVAVDRVKAVIQVPEREAIWTTVGDEAILHVDAQESWEVKGKVSRASPSLDSVSRTRQIEIDLDNRDHKLMPGMYGQVSLILQTIADAQAIPATAVYSRGGINYILLVNGGIVHRQPVRIHFDDGKELDVAMIIDGKEQRLDGSEELIVSNKGEIAAGQKVRAIRRSHP
jgi:RND family efflux transporter MFP subunit